MVLYCPTVVQHNEVNNLAIDLLWKLYFLKVRTKGEILISSLIQKLPGTSYELFSNFSDKYTLGYLLYLFNNQEMSKGELCLLHMGVTYSYVVKTAKLWW